jgi:hypothetical protein
MSPANKFNLEKSLSDLEELVEELESGDLPLEKAMKIRGRRGLMGTFCFSPWEKSRMSPISFLHERQQGDHSRFHSCRYRRLWRDFE